MVVDRGEGRREEYNTAVSLNSSVCVCVCVCECEMTESREKGTFIVISVSLVDEPSGFTDLSRTCSSELE